MWKFLLFTLFIMSVSCSVVHGHAVEARSPGWVTICFNQNPTPLLLSVLNFSPLRTVSCSLLLAGSIHHVINHSATWARRWLLAGCSVSDRSPAALDCFTSNITLLIFVGGWRSSLWTSKAPFLVIIEHYLQFGLSVKIWHGSDLCRQGQLV